MIRQHQEIRNPAKSEMSLANVAAESKEKKSLIEIKLWGKLYAAWEIIDVSEKMFHLPTSISISRIDDFVVASARQQ
jgi:hypothetical protein